MPKKICRNCGSDTIFQGQCDCGFSSYVGRKGYWTGKKLPPEMIAKMKVNMKGRIPWNKGLRLSGQE